MKKIWLPARKMVKLLLSSEWTRVKIILFVFLVTHHQYNVIHHLIYDTTLILNYSMMSCYLHTCRVMSFIVICVNVSIYHWEKK